jgi:sec-independent protein translocase protein TatB
MFGIGMPEMLLILAVALIIIGPKKLPDLAKSLGRALGEFKRATNDLKESIEMETGLDEVRDNLSSVKDDLKTSITLADAGPASATPAGRKKKRPESPLDKVKEAFDELNTPADVQTTPAETDTTKGEEGQLQADEAVGGENPPIEDDEAQAMGEDHHSGDKATP